MLRKEEVLIHPLNLFKRYCKSSHDNNFILDGIANLVHQSRMNLSCSDFNIKPKVCHYSGNV